MNSQIGRRWRRRSTRSSTQYSAAFDCRLNDTVHRLRHDVIAQVADRSGMGAALPLDVVAVTRFELSTPLHPMQAVGLSTLPIA